MQIIELTTWLQSRSAVREVRTMLNIFAADRWRRSGSWPCNAENVKILQARIAEELRCLDDPVLAGALVGWILRPDLTAHFVRTYVHSDRTSEMFDAIPQILEHIAGEVGSAFARSLGLDA